MQIAYVNEHSPLLPAIVTLGDENSQYLGFFAAKAFQRAAALGNIIAASEGQELLGYVLFYVAKSRVVIQHLCVTKAHQRKGVGRSLVNELRRQTSQYQGILLHCNRTFPAYENWLKMGFVPLGEKRGRGKAENTLTRFWLDYGHPDLITEAIDRHLNDRKRVVLDLNILYDLHDFGNRPQDSKALMADWIRESIAFMVTDQVFVEIDRLNDAQDRKIQKDKARGYARITPDASKTKAFLQKLEKLLPGDEMSSDRRHLALTAASGVEYFITRDEILTSKAEDIFSNIHVTPMHPTTFVLHYAESQDKFDYEPIRLAGSSLSLQRLGASQAREVMECFLDAPNGETKAKFNERLRTAIGRPDRCEAWFARHGERMSATYVAVRNELNHWQVPLFRAFRNHLSGIVVKNLVLRLLSLATQSPATIITIDDPYCSEVVLNVLPNLGFKKIGDSWVRAALCGIHAGDSAVSCIQKISVSQGPVRDYLDTLTESLRSAQRPDSSLVDMARVHRAIWPGKADNGRLPTFIVPIQAKWAINLFDTQLADQQLFEVMILALNWEQAYYRSSRTKVLSFPGRILWYVSHAKQFTGTGAIRACSTLDEVAVGSAKEVFKKFERLGVFKWSDVKEIADRNPSGEVMGCRFGMTENFRNPVPRDEVLSLLGKTMNTRPPLSTAVRIPPEAFAGIYTLGTSHGTD